MLKALAKLSITINGFSVLFKNVPDAIRRFCVPAMLYSEDCVSDVAMFGSAFFFRYRGRNFALCARHQFGKGISARSGEDFTLMFKDADGRDMGLNPNRITKIAMKHPEHANLADLFLAEYEDQRGVHNIRSKALELDLAETLDRFDPEQVKLIFAFGYPLEEAGYEFEYDDDENPVSVHVTARVLRMYLELDGPALLDTENRRPMAPDRRDPSEPGDLNGFSGFSGAPVFFLALDGNNNARLGFAGMITHARRGLYMVYDSLHIRQVVDRYIEDD
jgi:hypothetical protein